MKYKTIGVMCGSSEYCDNKYLDLAFNLGKQLAKEKHNVLYGGGAKGLMRRVADGALESGGIVDGYIPKMMIDVEWQHKGLTNLFITKDMDERKSQMMNNSDATIFLPGGSGTMEEFFVWLTSKRLGLYTGPLVIVNLDGYYDPLLSLLENMEKEKFHREIHRDMFSVALGLHDVFEVLEDAPDWSEDAITTASVNK